jgi:8-oxo-dGTP pyrophosphatase MutT (NUDIX family)
MSYKISKGIPEARLAGWLEEAAQKYGTFKDKRVNYTKADIAPIVMCTVRCDDEILIVKRGYGLADAEGVWSTVNGFIDEPKPVSEQAQQELREELGLVVDTEQIAVRKSYTVQNPNAKRHYIVFSCLISLPIKPDIVLDRENTDYKWIKRAELEQYETLDDLSYAIDVALDRHAT